MTTAALIVAAVFAVIFAVRWRRAERKRIALAATVARLAKWEKVADADDAVRSMLEGARAEVERTKQEAASALAAATEEAAHVRQVAEEEAGAIRREALARTAKDASDSAFRLADAEARAQVVIDDANRKAEEIAGDALRALREAKELDQTVKALENVINGYGDRYIVPTHSILDDLAATLAHTDAGQKLKLLRERVRDAVRRGQAGSCDYVEENRRETAVRFVVDAFNGKVDSILSRIRHENIGTLEQQLRDAAAVVNQNGKAFRNAHIKDEYLTLRIEELKWAVVANEIKDQEREEQRQIKERIREEEKARKEYERAIREAARDEELLRKAMEKARQELLRASDEQKAEYEAKLQDLQRRLTEAEQRNQRALSMAQQTRRGHVYVISNIGSFGDDVYKIGLTRRLDPLDRIRELGDSSVPFEFDVHALIFAEDAPALEAQLHRHFALQQLNKVNHRKEFFRVTLDDVRREMETLGLNAAWTMAAAARRYRESLAIEKIIAESPVDREAWLKRQFQLEPLHPAVVEDDDDEAA
jgi:hypothetical protein